MATVQAPSRTTVVLPAPSTGGLPSPKSTGGSWGCRSPGLRPTGSPLVYLLHGLQGFWSREILQPQPTRVFCPAMSPGLQGLQPQSTGSPCLRVSQPASLNIMCLPWSLQVLPASRVSSPSLQGLLSSQGLLSPAPVLQGLLVYDPQPLVRGASARGGGSEIRGCRLALMIPQPLPALPPSLQLCRRPAHQSLRGPQVVCSTSTLHLLHPYPASRLHLCHLLPSLPSLSSSLHLYLRTSSHPYPPSASDLY
ncbi:unnamed protein product [Arctogadus glacialis]